MAGKPVIKNVEFEGSIKIKSRGALIENCIFR